MDARSITASTAAKDFCLQSKALLEKEVVAQGFIDLLKTDPVQVFTIRAFAVFAVSKDQVDSDIIDASGVSLNFGQKVKVRLAWESATNMVNSGQGSSPGVSSGTQAKMPHGTEAMLRKDLRTKHSFNLNGVWLCAEDAMAKLWIGFNADPP